MAHLSNVIHIQRHDIVNCEFVTALLPYKLYTHTRPAQSTTKKKFKNEKTTKWAVTANQLFDDYCSLTYFYFFLLLFCVCFLLFVVFSLFLSLYLNSFFSDDWFTTIADADDGGGVGNMNQRVNEKRESITRLKTHFTHQKMILHKSAHKTHTQVR